MSLSIEDQAKIGGSDISGLLGLSQWSTPLSIYARIVAALEGRPLKDKDSAPKRRGRVLERAVLDLYAAETGATLKPGPKLTHPRFEFIRSSLDSLAEKDGTIVVDAKTVGPGERRHFGEPGSDHVRQDILFQMTLYVGVGTMREVVTRPEADVPVLGLSGADLQVFTVGFDAELFAMLEAAAERFWMDHVLPRRPPPVTEPQRDAEAVSALYLRHAGDARQWDTLSTPEQVAVREWLQARKERQRAEKLEVEREAQLKLLLGITPRIEGLPPDTGAKALTYRHNKAGKVTDWEGLSVLLGKHVSPEYYRELVEQCTTTKDGARPLRVTDRRKRNEHKTNSRAD